MNYEQKYKEALERAREKHYNAIDMGYHETAAEFEFIFPELKESKDERVKKAIMHVLYENYTDAAVIEGVEIAEIVAWFEEQGEKNINRIDIKEKAHQIAWETSKDYDSLLSKEALCEMAALDMASWLEKQGEPKDKVELAEEALKYVARQFMNWLDASTPEDKMCLSNMECEDIEDAFLKDDWARITHYIKKKLEKQEDTNETSVEWSEEDKQIICSIEQVMNCASLLNIVPEKIDNIKSWLKSLKPQKQWKPNEKQGEQTQLDYEYADIPQKDFAPIESKFKKKVDADKVIEWLRTRGSLYPIVTIKINDVIAKFKKDFGL